ncbi:succinate-semialdehyde dehydrogenase [Flavobacterium branchiophilum NBRC 15030 = ATCC 35035]|uniref:Succinate-semialdehyde dehydrogenase/glutarate-semialdehyde dehydrogenase n=1 Tax=Flavobacterium branchiophilum TaxID=55197 RepID=A0A543G653_9FLAO|nr:NAD-dependent succinate-semialdehyde dehydrogenase [Flavobacterium branchiophilum]OXA80244.1 succinate-semialdehyde dehydrogenase [Flavobacterium branchiophilum NBRC 15030 = ATCC 35035]TQM41569.1 succinate-semialdehyde dehydrogenase/glutarate-semialdehyde dehydrogenase [Flavobacterium branchiophilum]GEM56431.1 succinate-semialdehyde dehydrogenase [Flavobacterium branchiophilum NBRC 15030 = ATCC 35035]
MTFKSTNPYTNTTISEHEILTQNQLQQHLLWATKAFDAWKNTTFDERAYKMKKVAEILRANINEWSLLITNEMGKILSESKAEIEKSATNCDFYAENAEQMLKDKPYNTPFYSRSVYDPTGAVFAIMPWNYPFWQVFRYAAPAIMSGNVTLLKHAPNVIGCAKAIENIFLEAGFPKGVFQQLTIDVPQIENVMASNIVQGVTFTGSERAGVAVATLAAKHLKKTVLEMGGSDAFIVLKDADLEKAATIATQSRMINAGQACICAKRCIVVPEIADDFAHLFAIKIKQLTQGNPLLENTSIGPLARLDIANNLRFQLQESLQQGAQLITGGNSDSCHFQPTLLDNVTDSNIAFQQETFGPLATIIRATNEQNAIDLANNHRYGLAASIWTKDTEKAYNLARKMEAGNVFVNSMVRSDSRIPFGGIKKSGYGKELASIGIKEFMNIKSIIIE